MKKVIVGSVLAAGVAASLVGSIGTASAAPGVSFSSNGNEVGIGDHGPTATASGARAVSTNGNNALAISTGLSPQGAKAFAIGGSNNNAFATDGVSSIVGGARNNVGTIFGATTVNGGSDNFVVNAGSLVAPQNNSNTSVALCGGSVNLSAQGTVTTGKVPGGVC